MIRTRFVASQIRAMGHDTDDPRKFGAQDPPMPREQQSFPGTVRRPGVVLPINSIDKRRRCHWRRGLLLQ